MKSTVIPLSAVLVLASAGQAATTVNVSLSADGGSRFYEYFSDAFAQLDRGFNGNPALDGFYLISDNVNNPGTFTQVGGGADVFPHEGNWSNVGSFTLNGTATGIGVELFTITGATFDFSPYIADDDSIANAGYTTSFSSVPTGTITLTNGVVTDLSFTGPIVFTYDTFLGSLPYEGTLAIDETGFNLAVDGVNPTMFGDFRYRWDATGGSSFAVVPEPSVAMLGLLAGVFAFRRRR